MRARVILFVTICVVAATVAIGYSMTAADRNARPAGPATAAVAQPEALAAVRGPYLGYIGTRIDSTGSRFAVAPSGQALDAPALTDLQCKVAHAAAGRGICLEYGGLVASDVIVFDERFRPLHKVPLPGFLPSRARVASDGKLGAVTVFVSGHSYAVAGFSTFTGIIDLTSGQLLASLEDFKVTKDGRPFSSPDFNFWGVTFAKEQGRFYATLGTGGETYLVEADMETRTARVLRSNVECPSLSPDGTRLVFKKRVTGGLGPVEWRLHVLDLATMKETPLSETRNIDDQAEWLDGQRVAYSAMRPRPSGETDTWVVPVDGSQQPSILVPDAQSPVAVHRWG